MPQLLPSDPVPRTFRFAQDAPPRAAPLHRQRLSAVCSAACVSSPTGLENKTASAVPSGSPEEA